MINYFALLDDPRPDLPGSLLWKRLFLLVPTLENKKAAEYLQRHLWGLRNCGTLIKRTHLGIRFHPLIAPAGLWESEKEFKELKKRYLEHYSSEVTFLLSQLHEEF